MEYFLGAFKQITDFSSRTRRKDYWMFILVYIILYFVLSVIDAMLESMVLGVLFSLVMLVPSISIATRRLHDTGRSGWWQLIAFIPLVGIIVLIVFLVQDTQEANKYGPNPKLMSS
jgi:uncharacterized membrane protein YhaH (DUF805 family)